MPLKQLYTIAVVLFVVSLSTRAQHPVVQRIINKDPQLLVERRSDENSFIIASAIDKHSHTLYFISRYGYVTDSAQVTDADYRLLEKKEVSAFSYYETLTNKILEITEHIRRKIRQTGKLDSRETETGIILQMVPELNAQKSNLQKLLILDNFARDFHISRQLLHYRKHSGSFLTIAPLKQSLQKAGTIWKNGDSSIFYNRDVFSSLGKAVLLKKKSMLVVYNNENQLIDSLEINTSKIPFLEQQKTDVFLLYRGWLELEKINGEDEWQLLAALEKANTLQGVEYSGFRQQLIGQMGENLSNRFELEKKLLQAGTPNQQAIAAFLNQQTGNLPENNRLLEALNMGYSTQYNRGNKKYELTDHRGNVMAVVTDRKLPADDGAYQKQCYPCFPGIPCPPCEYEKISGIPDGSIDYYSADIVSVSDLYPFGMQMPGRTIEPDEYRYSINGQEKDPELNRNITTALYWEYDSRIGRRWNTDPVVKVWQTPYETFRDNPIIYTDPDGDDDIFDRNGKFLFSTPKGNSIRVINSGVTAAQAQKNPTSSATLLTKFSYLPANKSNRSMLAAIATFYAAEAGVTKDVQLGDVTKKENSGAFAYYNPSKGTYHIAVYNGKINLQAGNRNNMINSYVHEKVHEDDYSTHTPLNHTNAILKQIADPTFDKTTRDFKQAAGTYAAGLLNEALQDKDTKLEDVKAKILEFNNSKLKTVTTLVYDEKTKTVTSVHLQEEVIVKSKPRKSSQKKKTTGKGNE